MPGMGKSKRSDQANWAGRVALAHRALHGAWPHLIFAAAALLLACVLYLPLAHVYLDYEDGEWMRAAYPAYRNRIVQFYFMNRVLLPLLGHRVEGYFLAASLLHLLTAGLVYIFLIMHSRWVRTTSRGSRWPVWAGAAMAGLAFVSYQADNLSFLSGMSYQLFAFFGLGALIFSLHYLGSGRTWSWGAGVICTALGLLSHSYGLTIPLVIGGLELIVRRSRLVSRGGWNIVWRYGLHLVPIWFYFLLFGSSLVSTRVSAGRILGHLGDPTILWVDLLHFVNYMQTILTSMVNKTPGIFGALQVPFPSIDIYWSLDRIFFGCSLLLITALGVRALLLRKRAGVGAAALMFLIFWSGATFHQTLLIGYDEQQDWRFYHNVVGWCLLLGFVLARALTTVTGSWRPAARQVTAVALVLAGTAAVMVTPDQALKTLAELRGGRLKLKNNYSWTPGAMCSSRQPVAEWEVKELLSSGASLSCRDFSHLNLTGTTFGGADLRGADFTGAILRNVGLSGAKLQGAGFSFAELERANLSRADLRSANFSGAGLKGTDLTGANLKGAVMVGAFRYDIEMKGLSREQVQQHIDLAIWRAPQP